MAITHIIPEGTTEPQDFQLKADGDNLDGTGLTLGIKIDDRDGTPVTLIGTIDYLVQANGTVRVLLDKVDLPLNKSAYHVRFSITTGSGKVAFIPNGRDPDIWQVVPVP